MMVRCSHKKCDNKKCPHYEPHERSGDNPPGATILGPSYCTGANGFVRCLPVPQG
jgi:hypothetical protein